MKVCSGWYRSWPRQRVTGPFFLLGLQARAKPFDRATACEPYLPLEAHERGILATPSHYFPPRDSTLAHHFSPEAHTPPCTKQMTG